jgi:hypothetical protein
VCGVAALKSQYPSVSDEMILALVIHFRLLAAKLSGNDIFDLSRKAPFRDRVASAKELDVARRKPHSS